MTPANDGGRWKSVAPSIASYWVCSIGLVFLNKHLLSGTGARLNIPLFITWCQCLTTVLVCILLSLGSKVSRIFPRFPTLNLSPKALLAVLPLSIFFVAMISFNNLCLRNNGVSFYYIGRSTSTVFNVMLSTWVLGIESSQAVYVCCLILIIGFSIGSQPASKENPLSMQGAFFGLFASISLALNAIFTKKVLPQVGNCLWKLTWYNNVVAVVLFLPLMWLNGDVDRVKANPPEQFFWQLLFISGLFGFTMNYVTVWQIEATSPLTHNISATAKSATQTLLAVIINREWKPFTWWVSNIVILFGSSAYVYARHLEMKMEEAEKLKMEQSEKKLKTT
ncbi:hypothetical protein L3Y34_011174 [Caenorhabditis briggsae]|uniref:Sugar phosphate transporter domain-containing protein n=1 Tax=Caenorhabditis briggsae TaxID=6238 RepID=A0AAE8ZNA4_CAEBR|nr:hypothetical protein L3Y34_011174 [Caenorhabditis briggsae]